MLTNEEKYNNKQEFFTLLAKLNVDLTAFSEYLDHIDYFEKPATAQYRGSYAGGLCEYSLKLCKELGILCNAYANAERQYTAEDIIKVGLLRDLYRAEMYTTCTKNVKNEETGNWESIIVYKAKEGTDRPTFGDLGFSSYMIAKHFFDFTDEQIEAICHSFTNSSYTNDIHEIYRAYPLVTLTRMADLAVSYLGV